MQKALHTRDDIVSRKVGGRGRASIEDGTEASIQCIEKRRKRLITASRNNTENTKTNKMTITTKQKWEEKQLHGCSKRPT